MASLLVLLCMISAALVHCKIVTKTVSLDSTNESQDGATITSIRDVWYDTTTGEWGLYTYSNDGYQLHLFLDESWSFNATAVTNLSIQVAYNTDTNWYSYRNDFVVAFSQPDSDSFFAMKMYIDESSEHMIYPQWDTTAPYGSLATGDPATRAYRSLRGWDGVFLKMLDYPALWSSTTDYFSPIQSDNDRHVESPMTFTLSNVPTSHLQLSYSNPGQDVRSCGFNEMSSGTGMNVYFAMNYDANYDSLKIESISVTLSYEVPDETTSPATHPPTVTPSSEPSGSPTSIPTDSTTLPSENPSVSPSHNPTIAPSTEPSTSPTKSTSNPISTSSLNLTENPSVSLTHNPTAKPTEFSRSTTPSPTITRIPDAPSAPTRDPTARPTESDLKMTSTIIHEEQQTESTLTTKIQSNLADIDNQSGSITPETAFMFERIIAVIICSLVVCCCLCIFCLVCSWKQRKRSNRFGSHSQHPTDTNWVINANHLSVASGSLTASPQSASPSMSHNNRVNGQYVHRPDTMGTFESGKSMDHEPLFSVNPMNRFNMNTTGDSDDDSDSDNLMKSNEYTNGSNGSNINTLRAGSGDTNHTVLTLTDCMQRSCQSIESANDSLAERKVTPLSAVYQLSAAALQQFGSAVSMDVDEIGSSAAMESYTINSKEDVQDSDHIDDGEEQMTLVDLPIGDVPLKQNLSSHFSEGPKSTIGAMDQFMMFSSDIQRISVMHEDDPYS